MNHLIYCERTAKGISNSKAINEAVLSFPMGKRLEVVIRPKSARSSQQNRYFHACVSIMAKDLGYDNDEMKSIIKYKFLKREKINEITGEVFEYVQETHKLNKEDFSEFQNHLIIWSAQLGIILPLPEEQTNLSL